MKVLAQRLGHAKTDITNDIYFARAAVDEEGRSGEAQFPVEVSLLQSDSSQPAVQPTVAVRSRWREIAEAEARMSIPAAAEGSGDNCKQVDICGTWKTVCN